MVLDYLGMLGMLLILIAWIPQTMQNWRERGKNLNLRFVALYLFGSALLAYHAIVINDMVFLALNGFATLIAVFNAFIIFSRPKKPNKIKKRK